MLINTAYKTKSPVNLPDLMISKKTVPYLKKFRKLTDNKRRFHLRQDIQPFLVGNKKQKMIVF